MSQVVLGHGPRWWTRVLSATAVLLFLGEVLFKVTNHLGRFLSLDREVRLWGPVSRWSLPFGAVLSFLVLVLAGCAWLRVARAIRPDGHTAAIVFGLFMLWMSLDELMSIHETLEGVTGIDWQELYLPIVAAAGAATLWLLKVLRERRQQTVIHLLLGGGTLWVVAQVLELVQWDGDIKRPGYVAMMTVEEVLEFSGSSLFAVSAMYVLTHLAVTHAQAAPREATAGPQDPAAR